MRGEARRRKSVVVAAIAAAGLLQARTSRAEDPCAEDVRQLCGEVEVGGGRVQDCLRANEEKLSPACKAKRAADEEKFRALVAEFSAPCRADVARLCSTVKPGRGRVVACLIRQQDDLSSACRTQTDRIQTATETIEALRADCKVDIERMCPGVPPKAAPLLECVQANRENLSDACRSIDPRAAQAAAEIVDAIDSLSSEEAAQDAHQILQGIESIAFSRSQVLLQVDSFHGLGGIANANRLLFNPQLVFGSLHEFAIQLRAPVLAVYPYAPDRPTQTGLGAITTSFTWAFLARPRVTQYATLGLQWISPVQPPVGSDWAVTPGYAIAVSLYGPLSVTGQVAWSRSIGSSGYPEVNVLVLEPILLLRLPGRSFVAVDTKLGVNLEDHAFVPLIKGVAGIYIDRKRSISMSAWYQAALSRDAETQLFKFGVGTALAHFFDW